MTKFEQEMIDFIESLIKETNRLRKESGLPEPEFIVHEDILKEIAAKCEPNTKEEK